MSDNRTKTFEKLPIEIAFLPIANIPLWDAGHTTIQTPILDHIIALLRSDTPGDREEGKELLEAHILAKDLEESLHSKPQVQEGHKLEPEPLKSGRRLLF